MKYFAIFSLIILTTCCITGKEISGFNQWYKGQLNEIEKFCHINGYYMGKYSTHLNMPGGWTMMFFNDGICANNILATGQQDVIRGKKLYKISTSPSWGTYYIKNNIIVAQILNYSAIHESNIYEYKYKILNDSTLWKISSKRNCDGKIWINDSLSNDYILPMKFIKLENKPDSSCKLKEKRWFWSDKEKYKEYMNKLKEDKRRMKK